jgi:phage terminase Nu1 subunit (DNA packaging protein)
MQAMVKTEVTSRELAALLGLTLSAIADLKRRGIIIAGSKRGIYKLKESVRNYVEHLRTLAATQNVDDSLKGPVIEQITSEASLADIHEPNTPQVRADHVPPRASAEFRLMTKRVRSFRIYRRYDHWYTVWDK